MAGCAGVRVRFTCGLQQPAAEAARAVFTLRVTQLEGRWLDVRECGLDSRAACSSLQQKQHELCSRSG